MGIGGEEVFRRGVQIGEVAAAAAGDEDLLSRPVGVVEHEGAPSAPSRFDGAHQTGRACAQYEDIGVSVDLSHDAGWGAVAIGDSIRIR